LYLDDLEKIGTIDCEDKDEDVQRIGTINCEDALSAQKRPNDSLNLDNELLGGLKSPCADHLNASSILRSPSF